MKKKIFAYEISNVIHMKIVLEEITAEKLGIEI